MPDHHITLLARTKWRDRRSVFGIRQEDRLHHLYVIGATGTGKSTLLENLMEQDLADGNGFAFLDPHGDTVGSLMERIPVHRRDEVVYLNAPERSGVLGFNPVESVPAEHRALAASGILDAFKNVWIDSWGPRLEHFLRNGLLTLLDQPMATLADLQRLYGDEGYRRMAIPSVTNPAVRDFWTHEFRSYTDRYRAEAIGPVQNKVGAFLAHPCLYRILVQPKSSFSIRRIMDNGKVFLVNLAKGRLGAEASSLLGALLVSRIGLAALTRADRPEAQRRDFFLYLDEFQNVTTLALASMLSELRKYHVGMVLAHQYLGQLREEVRDAVLGNVGTIICFRVGLEDAQLLAKHLHPTFSALDLTSLPNHEVYLRMMVEGVVTKPFSAETLGPATRV
jgi:hypothetical protein